jgi:hypothetical protein
MRERQAQGRGDRKIAAGEKCGGRRSHAEVRPDAVKLAKELRRGRKSLREIAPALAKAGHFERTRRAVLGGVRREHVGASVMTDRIALPAPVADLYRAIWKLQTTYGRKFTLDGHALGSISR